jgi:anti-sigma factor RsiW
MIERLRTLATARRHPRPCVLSRCLEGELDASDRHAVEAHTGGPVPC